MRPELGSLDTAPSPSTAPRARQGALAGSPLELGIRTSSPGPSDGNITGRRHDTPGRIAEPGDLRTNSRRQRQVARPSRIRRGCTGEGTLRVPRDAGRP
jgi:hypothetical protein